MTNDDKRRMLRKIDESIPAYRPVPCECCVRRENQHGQFYHWPDCDCQNQGDLIEAAMWCADMDTAERYDKAINEINTAMVRRTLK